MSSDVVAQLNKTLNTIGGYCDRYREDCGPFGKEEEHIENLLMPPLADFSTKEECLAEVRRILICLQLIDQGNLGRRRAAILKQLIKIVRRESAKMQAIVKENS